MDKGSKGRGAAKVAMACRWKPSLRDSVKEAASAAGLSVNGFVEQALEEKLAASQPGAKKVDLQTDFVSDVRAIRLRIDALASTLAIQAPTSEEARLYAEEVRASAESVRTSTDRIMNDLVGSLDGFKRGQVCLDDFNSNLEATKKLLDNIASSDKNLSKAIASLAETPKNIMSTNRRSLIMSAAALVGCALISAFFLFPSPAKIAAFCHSGVKTALAVSANPTEVTRR